MREFQHVASSSHLSVRETRPRQQQERLVGRGHNSGQATTPASPRRVPGWSPYVASPQVGSRHAHMVQPSSRSASNSRMRVAARALETPKSCSRSRRVRRSRSSASSCRMASGMARSHLGLAGRGGRTARKLAPGFRLRRPCTAALGYRGQRTRWSHGGGARHLRQLLQLGAGTVAELLRRDAQTVQ